VKNFKFRLDPVLRYRRYLERLALMELAKAKTAIALTTSEIAKREALKKEAAAGLGLRETEGMSVREHRIYAAYLRGLDDQIEGAKVRLAKLVEDVRKKHEAAEAHRVKKETLEAIRNKEHNDHLEKFYRAQQKEADELFGLRHKIVMFQ
jgi:flagellar FliJ protein